MNLEQLIKLLEEIKEENDLGNPKISLFVGGMRIDIESVEYNEDLDEILLCDEDFS